MTKLGKAKGLKKLLTGLKTQVTICIGAPHLQRKSLKTWLQQSGGHSCSMWPIKTTNMHLSSSRNVLMMIKLKIRDGSR